MGKNPLLAHSSGVGEVWMDRLLFQIADVATSAQSLRGMLLAGEEMQVEPRHPRLWVFLTPADGTTHSDRYLTYTC